MQTQNAWTYVCSFFKNARFSSFMQLISSFAFSLVLIAFSFGPLSYIAFLIIWELLYGFCNGFKEGYYWSIEERAGVVYAGIAGYLVGRWLLDEEPFSQPRQSEKFILINKNNLRRKLKR